MTVVVGVDGAGRTHRLRAILAAAGSGWWFTGVDGLAAARDGLVVVDDAHRLDATALRALTAAARAGTRLAISRRPTITSRELAELDELAAADGVEVLAPLDVDGVAAVLATVTGRPVSPDVAAEVRAESAGMPVVVALSRDRDALVARTQRVFALLPEEARSVARLLALRIDLPDEVLGDAVPTLREAGLLVPGGERMIPALADLVLAELSPPERRSLHDTAARAMLAAGTDPVATATQLRAARIRTPAAAEVYLRAGEQMRFTDPAAALSWFDDAPDAGADPVAVAPGRAEAATLLGLPADIEPGSGRLALAAGAAAAHDGRAGRGADTLLTAPPPGPLLAVPLLAATGRLAEARAITGGPPAGPASRHTGGPPTESADRPGTAPTDHHTTGPSADHHTTAPTDHTTEPTDHHTTGPAHRHIAAAHTTEPANLRTGGPADHHTTAPADDRTTGPRTPETANHPNAAPADHHTTGPDHHRTTAPDHHHTTGPTTAEPANLRPAGPTGHPIADRPATAPTDHTTGPDHHHTNRLHTTEPADHHTADHHTVAPGDGRAVGRAVGRDAAPVAEEAVAEEAVAEEAVAEEAVAEEAVAEEMVAEEMVAGRLRDSERRPPGIGPLARFAAAAIVAAEDPVAAVPLLIEAAEDVERAAPVAVLPDTPHAIGAITAVAIGDLATAEHLLNRALTTAVGGPAAEERHRLLLAWARMRAGRYDTALAELRRSSEPPGRERLLRAAISAGIARRRGDIAGLHAVWDAVEPVLARQAVDLWQLEAVEELLVAAARLRHRRRIEPVLATLDEIVPPAWRPALGWLRVQVAIAGNDHETVAAQRIPGVLGEAAAMWATVLAGGTVDPDAVSDVTERLADRQLPWEASRLAGQAAITTTDPAAARRLLERARELSEPDKTISAETSGLSERELDVARMVLAGSTHREIGAQLYISPKTVEHHVARIRSKLGATSRAELLAMLRDIVAE